MVKSKTRRVNNMLFFKKKQSNVEVVSGMPHGSHWDIALNGKVF